MRSLLVALALLAGCAGPVPVSVVTTWDLDRSTDDPAPETREMIDEAFAVWGLSWETSDTTDAALELTLTWFEDGAAGVHGFSIASGDCDKSITVEPEALLLAHEVGHVFGIVEHGGEPGQVMSHPLLGWDVTDAQVERVAEDAERFSRCR